MIFQRYDRQLVIASLFNCPKLKDWLQKHNITVIQ